MGMLYKAETAEIIYASKDDSCTATDDNGNLMGDLSEKMSLQELKCIINEDPNGIKRPLMNEVKAHFKPTDLDGLFYVKLPSIQDNMLAELKLFLVQGKINRSFGIHVPIFEYNNQSGELKAKTILSSSIEFTLRNIQNNQNLGGVSSANRLRQEINSYRT